MNQLSSQPPTPQPFHLIPQNQGQGSRQPSRATTPNNFNQNQQSQFMVSNNSQNMNQTSVFPQLHHPQPQTFTQGPGMNQFPGQPNQPQPQQQQQQGSFPRQSPFGGMYFANNNNAPPSSASTSNNSGSGSRSPFAALSSTGVVSGTGNGNGNANGNGPFPMNQNGVKYDGSDASASGSVGSSNGSGNGNGVVSGLSALMRGSGPGSQGQSQGSASGGMNIPGREMGGMYGMDGNGMMAGSFPNQPHNSPTFPSNLSPFAQPYPLPAGSYSQLGGIPMSVGNMGYNFQGSMGMGMSISPQYQFGGGAGGSGFGGMSFTQMGSYLGNSSGMYMPMQNGQNQQMNGGGAGSVGGMGQSYQIGPGPAGSSVGATMGGSGGWANAGAGGERSRELEAKFVKDFTCCGLRLKGLHDLLEHYEECHVHLAPDLRKQSMSIEAGGNPENLILPQNPAINAISRTGTPSGSFPSASPFNSRPQPAPLSANGNGPGLTKQSSPTDSDAPGTPGMMDIEMMDEDEPSMASAGGSILPPSAAQWSAFQQAQQPPPGGFPQFIEPQKLSYAIPGVGTSSGMNTPNKPGTPVTNMAGVNLAFNGAGAGAIGKVPRLGGSMQLTQEQKAERAARKAQRKEAKRIAKENGELSSDDDGRDMEGFKKYRCPVPGCNKSYRQANGLKYHVQRSINSTHGHLIDVPLLPHPNHPDTKPHERTAAV